MHLKALHQVRTHQLVYDDIAADIRRIPNRRTRHRMVADALPSRQGVLR